MQWAADALDKPGIWHGFGARTSFEMTLLNQAQTPSNRTPDGIFANDRHFTRASVTISDLPTDSALCNHDTSSQP
jgi:hypothetical protein